MASIEQRLMTTFPTMTEIEQIGAIPDAVIRNLRITQAYHELALALHSRMIGANWCNFATWASKQAGQTIRKEDVARTLENIARSTFSAQAADDVISEAQAFGSPREPEEIQETVFEVLNPLAAFERASQAVARGNKKVFDEIGREFARFLATCAHDEVFDEANITGFCDALRDGDPPDGQGHLRRAFRRYYQATFELDPAVRAQLMLMANIEVGFHEQTRLQPEILEAMDATIEDIRTFRRRLIKALFPMRGWLAHIRLFLLRVLDRPSHFDAVLDNLYHEARRRARLLITEYMMTIGLPHGVILRLGNDLPVGFPESLKQITLADLRALLEQIDPTPDSVSETGTVDWANLSDRIHFILDMFRCYHESGDLFEPPFAVDQVGAFKMGKMPEGRL